MAQNRTDFPQGTTSATEQSNTQAKMKFSPQIAYN